MAKNMLVRAKILKVNTRFHAGIDVQPVTCSSFSPLLFMVPFNQQGNQVRICNKSFGEIHYHVA